MHHHGVAWAPEVPILASLGVIVGTLAITTVASLAKSRKDEAAAAADATTTTANDGDDPTEEVPEASSSKSAG
jgi:tellurite resistance protein TerC